jgi:hypothetical protein
MVNAITKNENPKAESSDSGSAVSNRLKMFQQTKKTSLVVTSTTNTKNIHGSNINSCTNSKEGLITSDTSGFIKVWKF